MEYISTLNKYISISGIYSEQEVEFFDKVEKEWKDSQVNYSFNKLVEIFPEAKGIIKKELKEEIEKLELGLARADELEKEFADVIFRKASKKDEKFWNMVCEVLWLNPLRDGAERKIKRNLFRLESLNGRIDRKRFEINVEKAKEYPIDELIEFNRAGMAYCIWHDEKHPSMHYYKKSNKVKCFGGCGKSGDSIDVCMQLYRLNFIEAVKKLTI